MRVAVLGTGIMGAGMAGSLARAKHDVVVWNRTRSKADDVAGEGIAVADSVADAVVGADAVLTVLFDADSVLDIASDLAEHLGSDAVWIQSSTVGPDGARRIAEVGQGGMLDAPVLGTKQPAEQGNLVVLVSGPATLVEVATPVFDAIGSRTVRAGDEIGQASALKLVCNAWIASLTAAAAQSITFATALGVDPALFLTAIGGGPSDNPYAQLKGKAMIDGDYTTSFAVDGVVKDVGLMIDAARSAAFPAELLDTVRELFERASADGHGGEDMAAVRYAFAP